MQDAETRTGCVSWLPPTCAGGPQKKIKLMCINVLFNTLYFLGKIIIIIVKKLFNTNQEKSRLWTKIFTLMNSAMFLAR